MNHPPFPSYLDNIEKHDVLQRLNMELPWLDPGIKPYLDRINDLDGLVTLQSCKGHIRHRTIDNGHLWIRPSEVWSVWFDLNVGELICHRNMERVAKLYEWYENSVAPIVILEIWFKGAAHGEGEFINSIEWICRFFENGAKQVLENKHG